MRRFAICITALICVAVAPSTALAQSQAVSGKITYIGPSVLTVQTAGRLRGVIGAMTATANKLTAQGYAYVWGGGHAEAGIASAGERGPGHNGRRVGFDCSGSVAAVLAGAGLWPAGSGVPSDAGVISQLLSEHLIARGAGAAPNEVTLYDDPGLHIFMNIDGRFFGTSDGGGGGSPKGGPSWLYDGAPDAYTRAYRRYHVLPSVLRSQTSSGQSFTFQTPDPSIAYGAELGDSVTVSFAGSATGTITATAVQYAGEMTVSGTVTAIAAGGSSLAIQAASGQPMTFSTAVVSALVGGLQVGDVIQVSYSTDPAGQLIPHALTITSAPAPAPAPSPPSTTPPAPGNGYGYGGGQSTGSYPSGSGSHAKR